MTPFSTPVRVLALAIAVVTTVALGDPAHRSAVAVAQGTCGSGGTSATWKAVDYPPGWNLIAGPKGSCLDGATALYGIQPPVLTQLTNDNLYSPLADTTTLPSGEYAYWAYFPAGGRTLLAPVAVVGCGGMGSFAESSLVPGEWTAMPNPSSQGPVTIAEGFSDMLLWSPASGYLPATEIPPGFGAWLRASATSGAVQYAVALC